jgi:hypothetical protein
MRMCMENICPRDLHDECRETCYLLMTYNPKEDYGYEDH